MDFFIQFVSSFASYVIIAYFIYSILGRKRTVSIVVLSVILISTSVDFIGFLGLGADTKQTLLYFMVRVFPVLFAFYTFMVLTGGISKLKFKRRNKPIKGITSDIQTKRFSTMISFYSLLGSLVFGVLVFFYIDGYIKYVIMTILVFAFIFSIYILINNKKISNEQIVLIIGKNRENIYTYQIPKDKRRVVVSDFFDNDNYIVDPIGIAILKDENKKIYKDYLYWIATSDKIEITDQKLIKQSSLSYQSELPQFEKYHYRTLVFNLNQLNEAILVKNKKIK